jgi:hypothetical protein
MANSDGFGVIVDVTMDRWGRHLKIEMEDSRVFWLEPLAFDEIYSGNGSTRFVTRAAYQEYRNSQIAALLGLS